MDMGVDMDMDINMDMTCPENGQGHKHDFIGSVRIEINQNSICFGLFREKKNSVFIGVMGTVSKRIETKNRQFETETED